MDASPVPLMELAITAAFDPAAIDLDLTELIPEQYATYGALVSEALLFFLGRLPSARVAEIIAAQLELPSTATAPERLVALMRECPTLHKLGQVVAHDVRLAPALRHRLQALESLPPSVPIDAWRPLIRAETGRCAGLELAGSALAEGSVAVVVPFAWRATERTEPVRGVFKILKPGVADRLHEELDTWQLLGDFLEARSAELHLLPIDYRDTLESVRRLLLNEIRLDLEQANLAAAAERYADDSRILVPRLLPLCTPRLTAMERVDGVKVTAARGLSPARRRHLGEQLVDALLARPFWNPSTAAPFHADPHAGNLLLAADGRLALLDWSLVVELGVNEREALMRLVLDAFAHDAAGMCRTLTGLARDTPDPSRLRAAVDDALQEVRQGRFPGLGWTTALLDRAATSARLRLPEKWVLFRKALLTLSGVVETLSPDCPTDRVLLASAIARCAGELALGPALARRAFGCHLFAADLAALCFDWPAAAGRYWAGHVRDWGAAFASAR